MLEEHGYMLEEHGYMPEECSYMPEMNRYDIPMAEEVQLYDTMILVATTFACILFATQPGYITDFIEPILTYV